MEMLLAGEPITAQRALDLGLVNAIAPQAQVVEAALKLAARISVNAPLAVQASKRIARGIIDGKVSSEDEGWAINRREREGVMTSEDAKEGPRAFAEKRQPVWKGR
jgi:crotonobetainyl-CoA hydratase